jgi:CPA2 family monovalent cation:H+ antiporter-2
MLFNPGSVIDHPYALAGTLALVVAAKPAVAFLTLRLLGRSVPQALTVAAGRAQIGEFSFILTGAALALGLLPQLASDLVLSAAILSILINPLIFEAAERWVARHHPPVPDHPAMPEPAPAPGPDEDEAEAEEAPVLDIAGHAIVAGYGRVGRRVAQALIAAGERPVVIDLDGGALAEAQAAGAMTLTGNSADPDLLRRANLPAAKRIFVTLPEAFEAGQVVEQARRAVPEITIYARAHSDEDEAHLTGLGASLTIMGEREIADRMIAADADAAVPKA